MPTTSELTWFFALALCRYSFLETPSTTEMTCFFALALCRDAALEAPNTKSMQGSGTKKGR